MYFLNIGFLQDKKKKKKKKKKKMALFHYGALEI
jgi:hypothetical protein